VGYPGTCYNWSITKGEIMSEASEELKRIAVALEEILRLVKLDQEKYTAREAREMSQKND